jgi:hypothetical protein
MPLCHGTSQEEEMKRLFFAAAFAASLLATAATPAAAITKTYVQDFVHPYVGLIGFYNGPDWTWSHRCTGELIAPTVVLTAGHCTDNENGGVNDEARIWFEQGAGTHFDGVEDPITGYPVECLEANLCAESHLMFNYAFDNFAGFPNIHDIGIVILDKPVTNLGYATLAAPGTLDPLLKARGTQTPVFTVSGYGISFSAGNAAKCPNCQPSAISFRERLMAKSTLVTMVSHNTDGFTIQLNGNGDSRGGTCSGDSGGPVFYPANSNQIVAVTSWGMSNAGCRGDGWYYRTDRQAVLDFITSVIPS